MKNNQPIRKHKSSVISQLLGEITPLERTKTTNKMTLAARIDDLIQQKGYETKGDFAQKVGKNASEITKWLSGTQNFTVDTLTEIAFELNISIGELFVPKQTIIRVNEMRIEVTLKVSVTAGNYTSFLASSSFSRENNFNTFFGNIPNHTLVQTTR